MLTKLTINNDYILDLKATRQLDLKVRRLLGIIIYTPLFEAIVFSGDYIRNTLLNETY